MMRTRLAFVVALALTAQPALAHDVMPGVSGFTGGMLHALLVPSHLMALLALALVVARQARGRFVSEAIFAAALIGGLGAIAFGAGESPAPLVLLGTSALCGALAACALPVPSLILWLIAVVTGTAVALDSPPDAISIREAYVMMAGVWLGAMLVLAIVAEAAARLTRPWQLIGLRVVGSWIAASAILVLALRLAASSLSH
jgi:urease accessory protein